MKSEYFEFVCWQNGRFMFIVIFRKTQADFYDTLMKKWQKQLL